jgi:hypothetical protein
MKKHSVSPSLAAFVDSQIESGGNSNGAPDPLYPNPDHQRISRLARSAETRSGLVLQRALFETLKQNPELAVLNPRTFPVTREVLRELDLHTIEFCRGGVHLPISENIKCSTELDIVTIRHRDRLATVYEVRRGSGGLGYRAMRETLRKLVGAQMLLRDYIHRELGVIRRQQGRRSGISAGHDPQTG